MNLNSSDGDIWKLRREQPRVTLRIPITLEGNDKLGVRYVEETFTENVSRNGTCVETDHLLEVGSVQEVSALSGKFKSRAQVAIVWSKKTESGKFRVGLRFLDPLDNWVIK